MPRSLFRYMWQHIIRRATQSILLVIGVMIGVAMVVAIDIANNSASAAFELSTESITGRATHEIVGGPKGFDESIYTHIRTEIGWEAAAPIVQDYMIAPELDHQPLLLLGVDPFAERPFRDYIATSGNIEFITGDSGTIEALGRLLVQPNTVLMSNQLAERYGIQPNDSITLQYGADVREVTVVGLIESDDDLTREALRGTLIVDIATAQELLNMEGRLSRIDLIIDRDTQAGEVAFRAIEDILPTGVLLQKSEARSQALVSLTDTFTLNLTAMSLLALVVGMFLVYNTVMFSVVQRRPVIGTLRSVGVTRRQIFVLVLTEAAILSTVGAIFGLGLGIILGQLTVNLVTQTINDAFFTVTVRTIQVTPLTLLKGIVVGVGAAVVAALLPSYEATFTPPVSSIRRSEIEERTHAALPYITAGGLVLAMAGGLMLIPRQLVLNFGGIFGIIVGLALLTMMTTVVTMRLVRPVTGRLGGMLGRMAPQSITRNLSRTSVAIAALMVAVSVIVGVTVMVGSLRITVEQWLADTLRADIFISVPNLTAGQFATPLDPQVINDVESVDGIERVIYVRSIYTRTPDNETPLLLNAIMSDISQGNRSFVYSVDRPKKEIIDQVINGNGLIMTENFANNRDIEWRDDLTLTLMTDSGPVEFPVLGIYQDFTTTQGGVAIGLKQYRQLWNDDSISSLAAYVTDDADIDTVVQDVQEKLSGYELLVQSNAQIRTAAMEVFDRTFAITGALNLLATVVAFIGILSALMALQLERRKEIGIMRSNGLTRGQLFRLTLWETGLMGATAGTLALPVGLVLAFILIYVINLRSFGWTMEIALRPEFFIQAFAVAVGAALLAGLYPAWHIGRIQPSDALRQE
ncbi:MAG: ABC transporter permease [Chloroflexi bacterium]|nr:ABC transporter permease [Chloroflexota bacterium]